MPVVTEADILRWLGELYWPFIRTLALFAAAPAFNSIAVPMRLKVALALLIAILVAGLTRQQAALDLSWHTVVLTIQQIVVGAAMGLAMQLALAAIAFAGDLVGIQMGFGFAALLGIQSTVPIPVMSDFFGLVGLMLFLAFNGHLILIGLLVKSFDIVPVAADAFLPVQGWGTLADSGAMLFATGMALALPVVAVLLTLHVAVGTLSRVAPQLNLMSIGFAAFLWVGIAATIALVPYLVPAVEHAIENGVALIGAALVKG